MVTGSGPTRQHHRPEDTSFLKVQQFVPQLRGMLLWIRTCHNKPKNLLNGCVLAQVLTQKQPNEWMLMRSWKEDVNTWFYKNNFIYRSRPPARPTNPRVQWVLRNAVCGRVGTFTADLLDLSRHLFSLTFPPFNELLFAQSDRWRGHRPESDSYKTITTNKKNTTRFCSARLHLLPD